MAICKQCGNEIPAECSFCTFCGAPIPQEPIPATDDLPPAALAYDAPAEPPAYAPAPAFNATPADTAPFAPTPYYAPPAPPIRAPKRVGPERITFANSFLSIMLLGIFLSVAFSLGVYGSPMFFSLSGLRTILIQFCMYGIIALAAIVSSRAKGPDLSIGPLMMLSGYIVALNPAPYYSPYVVMLIAVAVCAVIGLINGILINYANIPSLVVTLLTGFIVRYTCMLVTDAQNLMLTEKSILWLGQPLGAFLLLSIALVIAFFTILPSKLGTPLYRRDKRHPVSYMFAYAISGVIAGLAGIFVLARISAAGPSFGSGYEPFILLVYGCAAGSRALDNRIAPALYALAPALLYALVSNILILFGFSPLTQSIILGGLALVFILVAYLVRPELRGKTLMPKQ